MNSFICVIHLNTSLEFIRTFRLTLAWEYGAIDWAVMSKRLVWQHGRQH